MAKIMLDPETPNPVAEWLDIADAVSEFKDDHARAVAEEALAARLEQIVHPPRLVMADPDPEAMQRLSRVMDEGGDH